MVSRKLGRAIRGGGGVILTLVGLQSYLRDSLLIISVVRSQNGTTLKGDKRYTIFSDNGEEATKAELGRRVLRTK